MNQQRKTAIGGNTQARLLTTVTGYLAIIAAFFASFNYDWDAIGLCLGAANSQSSPAVAFGLLTNAARFTLPVDRV